MEESQDIQVAVEAPANNESRASGESMKNNEDSSRHSGNGGHSSDETVTAIVPANVGTVPNPNPTAAAAEPPHIQADIAQADGVRDSEKGSVGEQDGRRELQQDDCEDELGYAFSQKRKWWILIVIFLVQTSMNFNTSLYSNGIVSLSEEFQVPEQMARLGAALFLITYAFGCELWAPWSEEFGRKLILQLSLLLTNVWAIPVAVAPNMSTILVSRTLGGLSTAGGSVTLGMIADMYDSDSQQYAVAFVVFSSVFGSILGPIIGGFVELLPPNQVWRWCTWIQLIFGGTVQLLHLLTVPETRTTVMMDKIAKRRRKSGVDPNVYGPGEMEPFWKRFTLRGLGVTWLRAFKMLFTEPIVFSLSLLSGLSDAIVFMQIQSMNLVYNQWGFNSWQNGLAFVPFAIGYLIAWASFIPAIRHGRRMRDENPLDNYAQFELRLYPLLWGAPCLPVGLFIFAWTGTGPPTHWIGSMFGLVLIGIANYSIYMSTIDYMVCAYGPYSASATGGNGLARDLLAGLLTPAAIPFYTSIDKSTGWLTYAWASTVLAFVSAVLVVFAYYIYTFGPGFRRRSPFAQHLAMGEGELEGRQIRMATRRSSVVAVEAAQAAEPAVLVEGAGPINIHRIIEALYNAPREINNGTPIRPAFGPSSPRGSYMASVHAASRRQSRQASRNPTPNQSRRNSQDDGSRGSVGHVQPNLDIIDSVIDEPPN
ncbi:major facilitator superfamily domain-containing protein [Xylaria sp. FL1777]|nr:major facilitator superfamily domain-containing protein [Xylaria sp. FL1777]